MEIGLSHFYTYLANGGIYNRSARLFLFITPAASSPSVRTTNRKQSISIIRIKHGVISQMRGQVLRAKFLLHSPTLTTVGMRRQILVTIPNLKFYENPCGGIRAVPCEKADKGDEGSNSYRQLRGAFKF